MKKLILCIMLFGLVGCNNKSENDELTTLYVRQHDLIEKVARLESQVSFLKKNTSDPNWTDTQYRSILRRLSSVESDIDIQRMLNNPDYDNRLDVLEDQMKNEIQKEQSKYLSTVDPNDISFKFFAKPSNDWVEKLGESERTVLLFNISLLHARANGLEKRVNEILNGSDPNDIGTAKNSQ